jgi:hypothetical protein
MNRYVRGEQITPRLVWEHVRGHVVRTPCGYGLFDDTVRDKNASFALELVRHDVAILYRTHGDTELTQPTRGVR